MKNVARFNPWLIAIHTLCIFLLSYTLVIKSIFASTETLKNHMGQAGLFADISNLIKAEITDNLSVRLQDRIVLLALSERLLDAVVTPQLVERYSQPLLVAGERIIEKDLNIAQNNVVVDTSKFKQRATNEIKERKLPDIVVPYTENLIAAVPDQLQLVDLEKRPNSVLGFLTRAEILFGKINVINTIALYLGIATALFLIAFNTKTLRTLFKALATAYLTAGVTVLVGSFLFPFLLMLTANAAQSIYLNTLVSDAVYYYFGVTRTPSIILLLVGGIFFFLFKWSFVDTLQTKLDGLLNRPTSEHKKSKHSKR